MKPSLVFMGTPEFAVPSLQALINRDYDIKLVVCQPDRPVGRGRKVTAPPIKVLAEENDLEVFQPENLRKHAAELDRLLSFDYDFLVVAAFGQILPAALLDHPKVAPLNVHASLLPAYRGAAPIARSIIEDENETGITVQWIVEALDMGDILHQKKLKIEEDDTAGSLHDKLRILGAETLVESLEQFAKNEIKRIPQDPRVGSYAPKLEKAEAMINFDRPAQEVHRKIMGLNPWPVAECRLIGQRLRVFRSRFVGRAQDAEPGTIVDTSDGEIIVACQDACVALIEVQMENKKRMPTSDFLRGQEIPEGLVLGTQKVG